MAIYETKTQYQQQATNDQQAKNTDTANQYKNAAGQGQFPYATQGSQVAQQTGAASAGATQQQAKPAPAPMTFAEMQSKGLARPAPPPAPVQAPAPTALSNDLRQQISAMLANPDPYADEWYERSYASGARQIDDDFNLRRKQTDEELARRGVFDSSIAAGRYGDLNVGRRSAEVELQDRLATQRADKMQQARQFAVQNALAMSKLDQEERLAIMEINARAGEGAANRALQQLIFEKEFGQRQEEFAYRKDFDRQQLDFDYQRWLGLDGAEIIDPLLSDGGDETSPVAPPPPVQMDEFVPRRGGGPAPSRFGEYGQFFF